MATVCIALLIVVLAGSATAKLADTPRFFRALVALPWLSVGAARTASRAVPISELGLVILLIVAPRAGAIATLLELGLFTTVIMFELGAGRNFDCGCFGGVSTQAVGVGTVARNCLLASAAIGVLAFPATGSTLPALLTGAGLAVGLLLYEAATDAFKAGAHS